jgi:hypothetical protein
MTIRTGTDDLIEFLDGLAKLDPKAMGALVSVRVQCTASLAEHPTVQVAGHGPHGFEKEIPEGEYRVGILGILNGFAGSFDEGPRKGWGPISALMESDGTVSSFVRTENA